jgi:hypothetical protein
LAAAGFFAGAFFAAGFFVVVLAKGLLLSMREPRIDSRGYSSPTYALITR